MEPEGCGIKNIDEVCGLHSEILKVKGTDLGQPGNYVSVSY